MPCGKSLSEVVSLMVSSKVSTMPFVFAIISFMTLSMTMGERSAVYAFSKTKRGSSDKSCLQRVRRGARSSSIFHTSPFVPLPNLGGSRMIAS